MWNKILAVNSFIIIITFVFLIYAGMQAVFFWVWKPFWITLVILIIELIAEVALSTLND